MWTFANPVKIHFGPGSFDHLPRLIGSRPYAVVTYPQAPFGDMVDRLSENAGTPVQVIDDVAANPDYALLAEQCVRFSELGTAIEVIVAIGGGSVLDSAKVFAAANGDFDKVRRYLEQGGSEDDLTALPVIAVPTTAGTGSEVTCWATVWDAKRGRKLSLASSVLYPETAVIDPELMQEKPRGLTLSTGLDALSHALESIWNINANPMSVCFAQKAAREVIDCLPSLLDDLTNTELRSRMARAALFSGYAFSNTKTAIAHNLSYPITLQYGVPHGIACSFTLPAILKSVAGIGGFREQALSAIFNGDLGSAAEHLSELMSNMGVPMTIRDLGLEAENWNHIVDSAFAGDRGRNFVGTKADFCEAAEKLELV